MITQIPQQGESFHGYLKSRTKQNAHFFPEIFRGEVVSEQQRKYA